MTETFQPIRKCEGGNIIYTSDTLNFNGVETAGFLLRELTTKDKKHLVKQYIIASA
jgi:hypothetical protein